MFDTFLCGALLVSWLSGATAACTIQSAIPSAGPIAGGTIVNLTGTGFDEGSAWRCSFGDTDVVAEYDDALGWISCYTPSAASASTVVVNASIDGGSSWCSMHTSDVAVTFQAYASPNVSSISPASGSVQGGTVVTVTGYGFDATSSAHCSFGTLRVGDVIVAGAIVAAFALAPGSLECVAPSGDEADAVGGGSFDFEGMPAAQVVSPCVEEDCVQGVEPSRIHRFASGHNLTLLGKAVVESGVLKLTHNRFHERGAVVLSLYNPGGAADVPVRAFEASWLQMVGRGTGADGYAFVYGDLSGVLGPFDELGVGDGLVVRFRTYGHFGDELNAGHGTIQALYGGILLNETIMGDELRTIVRREPLTPMSHNPYQLGAACPAAAPSLQRLTRSA